MCDFYFNRGENVLLPFIPASVNYGATSETIAVATCLSLDPLVPLGPGADPTWTNLEGWVTVASSGLAPGACLITGVQVRVTLDQTGALASIDRVRLTLNTWCLWGQSFTGSAVLLLGATGSRATPCTLARTSDAPVFACDVTTTVCIELGSLIPFSQVASLTLAATQSF